MSWENILKTTLDEHEALNVVKLYPTIIDPNSMGRYLQEINALLEEMDETNWKEKAEEARKIVSSQLSWMREAFSGGSDFK